MGQIHLPSFNNGTKSIAKTCIIFIIIFHWSTEKLVDLMGRKTTQHSYATHHVCDLLFFAYLFVNTHYEAFL